MAAGIYSWTADYSGDANNDPCSSGCGLEEVTVGPVTPSIETAPDPCIAPVGSTLNDSATLSGGYNPTGSITFNLYGPDDTSCEGAVIWTDTVTVNGNGAYGTSGGYTAVAAGIYSWTADYSGDANNDPCSSGCGLEEVTVGPVTPSIETAPDPCIAPVGSTLNDSATLSGGYNPTGSITFNLYGPDDTSCEGAVIWTDTVTVNGNGAYGTSGGYTAVAAGIYSWTADYSGDANNDPCSSGCGLEEVTVEAPGDTYCSFTQGFYGNAGGRACGEKTADLIDELIDDGADPVVVGRDGHSITLASSDCIIDLLPAGGEPNGLPAGNFNCADIPESILQEFSKKESRFNNVLIGQVVALTLNVRLGDLPCLSNDVTDSPLGDFPIPEDGWICVVPYDDPDACRVPYESPIGDMTVADLLDLANDALAGMDISPYSLDEINDAVTAINEAFDECASVVSCPSTEEGCCDDGVDNDHDGDTDCEDSDCDAECD